MRFIEYLKDKIIFIFLFFFIYITILLIFMAFKVTQDVIFAVSFLLFFMNILFILIDYFRKRSFYQEMFDHIETLDKAYLVLEMISKPSFYEGKLMVDLLYEINRSMSEVVKELEFQVKDFKEYIEMWIHEVKIPLSSLILMFHNKQNNSDAMQLEIHRIEDYLEQVLYYVRSENAEHDYLIKKTSLNKVIGRVALKNKDYLLCNHIDLLVDVGDKFVLTDSKWLEFILNQIINNSIKYRRDNVSSYINISAMEDSQKVVLVIEDNGIGIVSSDISRVFMKSFTGYNGRIKSKSTGMGLFIVKELCEKLGHNISIESVKGEYTKVFITFSKNQYYDVVK